MPSNISDIMCDRTNSRTVLELSEVCVNEYVSGCIPKEEQYYRKALGIWAIIIGVVGVLGNILTLLAIPYAARKKR